MDLVISSANKFIQLKLQSRSLGLFGPPQKPWKEAAKT